MVIKLLKHELYCLFRVATIPLIVMVLLAILCRLSLVSSGGEGLSAFLLLFYMFAVMASLLVCAFLGITRFYQSLFTGEGYMTLSLPATPDEIIWAKLLSSIITVLTGIVICVLSACIFLIGVGEDIMTEFASAMSGINEGFGMIWSSEPLAVVEAILLILVSVPAGILECYFVMAIAQLFTTKNRTGIAVALYIGIAFIWGILSPIFIAPIMTRAMNISVHLYLWIEIVFTVAVELVCYFVVRYILRNKINLIA